MATERDRPYGRFNFFISWDGMESRSVQAGFMEVTGLGMEVQIAEYRAGNFPTNEPIKITGLVRVPDVTLKRGVIGSLDLYEWLNAVRDGAQDQLRTVIVELRSEDHSDVVQQWKLVNARPSSYRGPKLDARSSQEVAIEEITLACERIELS